MVFCRYYRYSIALVIASVLQSSSSAVQQHTPDVQYSTEGVEIIIVSSHRCPPCKRLKNDMAQLITLSSITPSILYTDDANDAITLDAIKKQHTIRIERTPTTLILRNKHYLGSFTGYSTAQDWWNRVRAILIQT